METLADAANVLVPAVLALRERGFIVSRRDSEGQEEWWAERSDLLLVAEDPLRLLGLAALREQRGSGWEAKDEEIKTFLNKYGYET